MPFADHVGASGDGERSETAVGLGSANRELSASAERADGSPDPSRHVGSPVLAGLTGGAPLRAAVELGVPEAVQPVADLRAGTGHGPSDTGPAPPNTGPAPLNTGPAPLSGDRHIGCTTAQLRRFIKSRAYVPMHEIRRRFLIATEDDDVSGIDVEAGRIFVGLPEREGQMLGELLRAGEIGYELQLDPVTPVVVGVYPMRPVTRG